MKYEIEIEIEICTYVWSTIYCILHVLGDNMYDPCFKISMIEKECVFPSVNASPHPCKV